MRKLLILALALPLFCFALNTAAQEDAVLSSRISQIQSEISAAGAQWTAGDNPIARLSDEEFRQMLGLYDDPYPPEYYGIQPMNDASISTALPSSYNLQQYMTSVKNQGSCGSCWAFAACAAFEGGLKKATGVDYNLSEQLLVSDCCSAGDCAGGWPGEVAAFINKTGVPEESCYPYRAANSSCSEACAGWQDKAMRSKNTYSVSQSVTAIKTAIYNYGPVHLGFVVFSDFRNYTGGIYSYVSGTQEGKHAVTAVGWDDSQSYFIVKNSWGSSWGESGYFRIAYSQVSNSVQFGQMANVFEVDGIAPPPGTGCEGYCGQQSPEGCWCDSSCDYYGDCCANKVQVCGY